MTARFFPSKVSKLLFQISISKPGVCGGIKSDLWSLALILAARHSDSRGKRLSLDIYRLMPPAECTTVYHQPSAYWPWRILSTLTLKAQSLQVTGVSNVTNYPKRKYHITIINRLKRQSNQNWTNLWGWAWLGQLQGSSLRSILEHKPALCESSSSGSPSWRSLLIEGVGEVERSLLPTSSLLSDFLLPLLLPRDGSDAPCRATASSSSSSTASSLTTLDEMSF